MENRSNVLLTDNANNCLTYFSLSLKLKARNFSRATQLNHIFFCLNPDSIYYFHNLKIFLL